MTAKFRHLDNLLAISHHRRVLVFEDHAALGFKRTGHGARLGGIYVKWHHPSRRFHHVFKWARRVKFIPVLL
jgi:hypothetical protein